MADTTTDRKIRVGLIGCGGISNAHLDGLAKSMGYELEFHWGYNPRTMERYHT